MFSQPFTCIVNFKCEKFSQYPTGSFVAIIIITFIPNLRKKTNKLYEANFVYFSTEDISGKIKWRFDDQSPIEN